LKRTPVKRKRAKPRRGPMRSPEYRRWLRTLECVLAWSPSQPTKRGCLPHQSVDPAHTQNNGMRSKGPDSSCVPLCRNHHREYDAGRKAFEAKYGVDMAKLASEHYARFKAETV